MYVFLCDTSIYCVGLLLDWTIKNYGWGRGVFFITVFVFYHHY
jgi:hypothetical protein